MASVRMGETVRIYKITCYDSPSPEQIGESCSLCPWEEDMPGFHGQDDGGTDYVLPKGYFVKTNESGSPAIFCGDGLPCGLILHNGSPILVDSSKKQAILFEPVKKILHMREQAGLSREELAECLGVSVKELFEWENREKNPEKPILERMAVFLKCNLSDLV